MTNNSMSEEERLLQQRKKETALRREIAQEEKAIAEAQQAIAEANQAKLQAQIPAGEAKPVEGKITTGEKFGYVAELTAYSAIIRKADAIAQTISSRVPEDARLLIVDSLDFCGPDVQLLQVSSQLDFWTKELRAQDRQIKNLLDAARAPSPLAAFAAESLLPVVPMAVGALSAAADIIGYFRIDYDIKGQEIELCDTALRARVAQGIQNHPVYLSRFHRIPSSAVIAAFNQSIEQRGQLNLTMAQLKSAVIDQLTTEIGRNKQKIQTLEAELKKLKSPEDDEEIAEKTTALGQCRKQLSEAEAAKSQHESAYTRAEALIKGFDEFNKVLTSVPAGKEYSLLANAAIRQYLDEMQITHLLYLTVTSSGGEAITGKGLFQSGRVAFLGGGVVTYVLADCTGKIIAADAVVGSSYVKFNLGQDRPPAIGTQEGT